MSGTAAAFTRPALNTLLPNAAFAPGYWVRDHRFRLTIGAVVWALTVLMIVPENLDYASLATGRPPTEGSLSNRVMWLSLLAAGASLIVWRAALTWRLTVSWLNPFLLLFIALAIASIAWSEDPMLTVRRLIRLLAITLVAIAFVVVGWHPNRFQCLLRPLLTLVLIGSIVFGLAAPQLATHQASEGILAGAWRGLANHKNSLGNLACITMVFWCHAALSRQTRWPMAILGGGIALACLVLADSATALITTVFTVIFLVMLMRPPAALRRYLPWLVMLFVAGLVIYSLALLELIPGLYKLLGPVSMATGKDMTFTGRTQIWDLMSAEIARHPLLGVGYGAYWGGPVPGTPAYEFVRLLGFYPASAHNGYLDTLNDLGVAGLLALLAYLATYLVQSLRLLVTDRAQASLYLALFLLQAISNLSESRWLNVQSVDFVIMTLATAALARGLYDQRLRTWMASLAPAGPSHITSTRGDPDVER